MQLFLMVILITAISGIGGTGTGGIVGALFKKDSNRTVSLLLSFAGGVMLSIVCFELVTEAIYSGGHDNPTNIFIVIGGISLGVGLVYLLNYIIDKKTNPETPHITPSHPKTADDIDELTHSNHLMMHIHRKDSSFSLFIAGIVMASAIALHNIPEGMTIGASYAVSHSLNTASSLSLAILIGLHNIPEGMAVVVPLIGGGMNKVKAVLITAASGIPTVIGGMLGFWLGDLGPIGLALSLSFASGAMLYVVMGEIIPQAILMYKSKLPAFTIIFGMLVGLAIIFI